MQLRHFCETDTEDARTKEQATWSASAAPMSVMGSKSKVTARHHEVRSTPNAGGSTGPPHCAANIAKL
jgi:hypothetical protein